MDRVEMTATSIAAGADADGGPSWTRVLLVSILVGFGNCVLAEGAVWAFVRFASANRFGPVGGEQLFRNASTFTLVLVAVLWAPIFETLVAQWAPIELLRLKTRATFPCVLVSALVFSLGHVSGGGGIGQMILTFSFGVPLAFLYAQFRKSGALKSVIAAGVAHCTNNVLVLILAFQIMPLLEKTH